jgi:hypothetical protein
MASSSSATRLSLFAAYLHFAATRPLSAARLFSRDTQSRLASLYGCLVPYWGDSINRVDATALTFSFAALVAFMSTGNSEDATATSLRAVAVFLLWLRVIRVLLISLTFGPYVLMFFRMLFGDVLYFMVLLGVLLVAFAASCGPCCLSPNPTPQSPGAPTSLAASTLIRRCYGFSKVH